MSESSGKGNSLELPDGWMWKTLGELSDPSQYGYTTKAATEGDLKFLRTTDISKGPINWEAVPYCAEPPEEPAKYRLRTGDLVISRSGSVGLNALIVDPPDAIFASYLVRFRPKDTQMGEYLRWFMQSPIYWGEVRSRAVGIGMNNINAKKLSSIPVPCPPVEIRDRTISDLKSYMEDVAAAESAVAEAQVQAQRLRDSVVMRAVTGRLHPRKPDRKLEGRAQE